MKNNPNPPIKAPSEKSLIFCMSLFHAIPPVFSRQNYNFKPFLKSLFDNRQYLERVKDKKHRAILTDYLTTKAYKVDISVKHTGRSYWGIYIINGHLQTLVNEIMKDYEAGILAVKEYKKPATPTEIKRKINDYCEKHDIPKKIPLREKSLKELKTDWENNRPEPIKET